MFLFQDTKRFKRSPESEESDESEESVESVESEENLDRDCTNKIKTHSYLKFLKLTWWEPGGAWWEPGGTCSIKDHVRKKALKP